VQWEEVFCDADDFCQEFLPAWEQPLLAAGVRQRMRPSALTVSEVMTMVIAFPRARFWDFKPFYLDFVCRYPRNAFPRLPSYSRFVELMPGALVPLCCAYPLGAGHRHRLYRLDPPGGWSFQARSCPPGVRGQRPRGQDPARVVLWVQAPSHHQR
jgi:hypothetical protein